MRELHFSATSGNQPKQDRFEPFIVTGMSSLVFHISPEFVSMGEAELVGRRTKGGPCVAHTSEQVPDGAERCFCLS
jgi:hypothetical protein